MRTCRARAAAIAAVLTFAMSACGGTGGAVALQEAADAPGADGADREDGGDAASGVEADASVAKVPKKLQACLTRNDEVVPWRDPDVRQSTKWAEQRRQAAHERLKRAVDKRLGLTESGLEAVRAGFLGYELDPVGNRLIMQLDPSLIDVAEFRRWVDGAARRANDAARVRGPKLTVTVQKGCFTARKAAALISFPRENTDRNGMEWMISHVQGRTHPCRVRRQGRRPRHATPLRPGARRSLPRRAYVQVPPLIPRLRTWGPCQREPFTTTPSCGSGSPPHPDGRRRRDPRRRPPTSRACPSVNAGSGTERRDGGGGDLRRRCFDSVRVGGAAVVAAAPTARTVETTVPAPPAASVTSSATPSAP